MNKIYKVIWSKAKHTYVVASEIAKGHTKGETTGKGLKKLAAAMLVAAALLSPNFAWAADTTKVEPAPDGSATAVEVYTKAGADKAISTNATNINTNAKNILSNTEKISKLESAVGDGDSGLKKDVNDLKTTVGDSTGGLVKDVADSKTAIDTEKTAREAGDKALDDRITAVKNYVLKETGDNYVSKADAAVQDAGVVKANKKIGENVTALGKGLYDETAARIGADAAQDKVIKQVNDNLVASVNTINKNVADGFTALNQAGANEAAAREAKDNELNERITNEANEIHKTTNKLQSDLNTETVAREAADTALDTRITNVKEYLEKQTSDTYVSKDDAAVQDGAIVKADKTIGENVTNLDAALAKETAARLGADKAQDKVIETVNQNMVDGFNTINKNMSDGFTALNQADANEAAARQAADTTLQTNIDNEAAERKAADTVLDDKITAETSARVAADTKLVEAVNSGVSLSNDNVLQKNTTTIDAQGNVTTSKTDANEMILNKGKDNQITLNEKGIKVGTNSSVMDKDGVYTGGDTYSEAKAALKSDGSIKGADGKFTVNSANGTVNVNDQIKLNGATGVVKSNGLNVGDGNFTVNSNGGVKAADGKITLNSDGSVKAANGNFTVNSNGGVKAADGKITLNSDGSVKAADGKFTVDTNGAVKAADGKFTVDSNGAVKAANGNTTIDSNGNVKTVGTLSAADGSFKVDSTGKITSTGLDAGNGTIQTTGTVQAGNVKTGTLETTGNATIGGDLTVDKNLTVNGTFDAKTLSSTVDANNYTTINGGKTQSMNLKLDAATGETKSSASTFDENGSNTWAKDDDSIGKSTVTADGISQKLSDTGDNPTVYAERTMSQGTDKKYSMVDTVKDGDKTNVASQTASESSSVVSGKDGEKTYKSYITQNLKEILQKIEDGDGNVLTSTEQTETDITNTAEKGTIANNAQNIINNATENMTNTVGKDLTTTVGGNETRTVEGTLTETVTGDVTEDYKTNLSTTVGGKQTTTVTGDVTEDYKANLSTTVGGSQTTTVTGDSSLTAENINNTAKNKITNKALDVETEAKSSIVNKVSNDAGSNTSTQLSYETKEEMSANGKTASYLRGAAEEKSQLTDGAKKTTIDTVAGQTNTNITDGTNTSNNLQKADQAASSVTDGTNTTVVNQDAKSLASSITDGAKANNTSSTVDASVQRIQTDDTHYSVSSKSASKMEDALFNGSTVIDSLKDAEKGLVSTAVNDGTNLTGSSMTAKGITSSAAESIVNEIGDGSAVKSEMTANGITNTAKDGTITNDAKDLVNTASDSITDKVGENVERTMTTKKISESVKDGTKSNTFSKTAEKDISIITDGTTTSTLSQLANSVNTSFKNGTQSLNNTKTVTEDVTKVTDTTTGAFSSSSQKADSITSTVKDTEKGTISERSQTVSQVQDKVGTTTVTTTDGLTKLTNEAGNHNTQMDFAEVLKDLGVRGNAVVDGTLEVGGKSTFKDDVTMEKNLHVKGITTTDKLVVNNGATVTGGTTTDKLHVTSTSQFDGAATFKDIVTMEKDLNVGGNAKVAGDVTAKSFKVGDKTYIDEDGINANNQVIRNVGQGNISEGSTDAVSGGQLYETNTRVSGLETRMGTVETKVDKLDGKIDKVGANAAAMANLHPLEFDEDSKWNIAAAVGSSGSETASAVGVFYRPNENVMVNASAAMGTGENMFGGVSLRLGHGGNKAKEAQMKAAAAENKELRAKVDDLTARMDALLSVLNPNMSKDFPDVPENHWAYEAVSRLAGNGIVEGYEGGKYHGERQMTRYEMAEIIYNALSKGAKAEKKLVEEFRPELQAMAAQKKA